MNLIAAQWKEIFQKKKLLITFIGLMFVPLLYGGIFLSAFWNPYGHSNQLKVAVINQDSKAQLSGKTVDLGQMLTTSLKKNKNFHWIFDHDKKAALQELERGNYYMVMVIPHDFSENASSFFGQSPKQVELEYDTNSGASYTAAQMVKSVIPGIDQQIARAVTRSYALALFSALKEAGNKTYQVKTASKNIAPLVKGANEINDGLDRFTRSSLLFKNGLNQADQGSIQLDIGIHSLHTGMKTLDDKITELNSGQNKLNSGVAKAAGASSKLHEQMTQFNQGLHKLNAEFTDILNYLKQTNPSVDAQTLTKQQMMALIETLKSSAVDQSGIPISQAEINDWMNQITVNPDGSYNLEAIMTAFNKSSADAAAHAQALTDASQKLSDALTQIHSGTKSISTGIKGIQNGSSLLYTGSGKIMDGDDQLTHGLGILNHQQGELIKGAQALNSGSSQMNSGMIRLDNSIKNFSNGLPQDASTPSYLNNSGEQANLMAHPVHSQINDLNQVNNYGEGLSPYILSLGLFVGALAFATFFPLRKVSKQPESGASWFWSKFSASAAVSIFQAFLICTLMLTVVGLKVTSIGSFYFFTIVSSLSFFALTQFLATAFKNTGRAIGGILLLIQFGGSSGIFPVSLTPAFFQWVHALLPMTYSVNGLRQIISIGSDPLYLTEQTLTLLGIASLSMALTWFTYVLLLKKGDMALDNQSAHESA